MSWDPEWLAPLGPRGARIASAVDAALFEGRTGDAAAALADAGDALAGVGLARPAQRALEAGLGFAVEARARRLEAELAWRLGQAAEATRRAAEAVAWYERAAARFADEGAAVDQLVALQGEARCRYATEGPAVADRLLREALAVARGVDDPALLASVMEQAAEVSQTLTDVQAAAARYRQAASLYAAVADLEGQVRATIGLAECELERGEHVRAIRAIEPIEPLLEVAQDTATSGRGLALIARFYLQAGAREEAVAQLQRALERLERAGADAQRANLLVAFARVLHDADGPEAAEPLYAAALSLYERLGDLPRIGPIAYSLARCQLELSKLPEADAHIDRALEVSQQLGDIEGLEVCTRLAVRIASRMGQVKLALERLRLAGRVKAGLGDPRGEVRYLLSALDVTLAVPDNLDTVGMADEFIEALRGTGTALLGPTEVYDIADKLDLAGRPDYALEIVSLQAQVELDQARFAEAARAFAQAARYAVRAEQPDQARALWDQAIAVGEDQRLPDAKQWRIDRQLFSEA